MISRTASLPQRKSWRVALAGPWRMLVRACRRAAQRRQLSLLTADQLADFGATRADQWAELSKPFWRE